MGWDLLTIQRIVGHRDLATTRRLRRQDADRDGGGGGQARGGDGPVVPKFLTLGY